MSLPTGGLFARSHDHGAFRISRAGTLAIVACAWTSATLPAVAQTSFRSRDTGSADNARMMNQPSGDVIIAGSTDFGDGVSAAQASPNFGAFDDGFTAFSDNGAQLANPDIAVGPDNLVVVVSGEIAWYDKNSNLMGTASLNGAGGLWDWILDPSDMSDVQVIWNANAGRYFVVAIGVQADGSTEFNYAISNTSNPSDGWVTRHDPSGAISRMSAGVYDTGLYVVFDYPTSYGTWYLRATLDELLDLNRQYFINGKLSGSPMAFSCNNTSGDGDGRLIVASAVSGTINKLLIASKNPAWTGGPTVTSWISIPWQSEPPLIEQLGAAPLDIGGMDFRSAKVVNDSCWLAQTIGMGDHAIVRWYEFELNGWPVTGQAPALKQYGDIDLGPGVHAFLPDIAVDYDGNAAIVFSISSASQRIALARVVRFATDPLGEFNPHQIIKQSTSVEDNGLWGAYVGIEADPNLPGVFWSHSPFSTAVGWNTYVGKITLAGEEVPPSDGPRLYKPDNGFIHNIIPEIQWDIGQLASGFRVQVSDNPDFSTPTYTSSLIVGNSHKIPDGILECNIRYYWRVIAETPQGDVMSNPDSRWFERRLLQDLNTDGIVDSADLGFFLSVFNTTESIADFNGDGIVNAADLGMLISAFGDTCN